MNYSLKNSEFYKRIENYQRNLILEELKRQGGNKFQTALSLGISRATLYKIMKWGKHADAETA